jgi:cyclohexa-1,5-dienecarbonyl-CoA hydratase
MSYRKIRLEFTHSHASPKEGEGLGHPSAARITLAAPKANILDRETIAELEAAFAETGGHAVTAIVLAADGPHFSFGASVEEHLPDTIGDTLAALHGLLRTVAHAPAPVIAAVRGQCLGGGFELVLACDLVIAEATAQFACPEIKLGVFAPAASALLPVKAGQALASRVLLAADSISGAEAAAQGWVARAVPPGELDNVLDGWLAAEFLPRSASSLGYACRAARLRVREALERELPMLERLYLNELMSTPDAVEGIRAFLEKRAPQWTSVSAVAR